MVITCHVCARGRKSTRLHMLGRACAHERTCAHLPARAHARILARSLHPLVAHTRRTYMRIRTQAHAQVPKPVRCCTVLLRDWSRVDRCCCDDHAQSSGALTNTGKPQPLTGLREHCSTSIHLVPTLEYQHSPCANTGVPAFTPCATLKHQRSPCATLKHHLGSASIH